MAIGDRVFPAVPQIIGGGRVLPSPSQFYLTGEDRLRIVSANSQTSVTVKIQWRMASLGGDTIPNSQDHTPFTDRSVKVQDYELGTGSLLNVTVFAVGGATRIGQTYVMVQLVRGFGAAAIVLGTILAGYITATQALGFPGSPIQSSIEGGGVNRTIVGTQPAAGAEIVETCPSGARWQLVGLFAAFTASVAAGNRNPMLHIINNAALSFAIMSPVLIAAGVQEWMNYASGLLYQANATGLRVSGPLAAVCMLRAGDQFQTSTVGLNAGDQWTVPQYTVTEWLEVQ